MYCLFFLQAEDGIRDLVRSRGLGDVYKRQVRGGEGLFAEGEVRGYFGPAPGVEGRVGNRLLRHTEAGGRSHGLAAAGGDPVRALPRGDAGPVSYTHLTLPTSDLV